MLFNSDWREDLRVLRLNNPSYRALFVLIDVVKWGIYLAGLALFVAFCWKIISPRASVQPYNAQSQSADTGGSAVSEQAVFTGHTDELVDQQSEQLSPERAAYLKRFASRARQEQVTSGTTTPATTANTSSAIAAVTPLATVNQAGDANGSALLPTQRDVTVRTVVKPEKLEATTIPASSREPVNPRVNKVAVGRELSVNTVAVADTTTEIQVDSETELDPGEFDEALNTDLPAKPITVAQSGAGSSADTTVLSVSPSDKVAPVDKPKTASVSGAKTAEVEIRQVSVSTSTKTNEQVAYTKKNRAYQTSNWVMAQKGAHYTIQIGATVNRPFLLRFIDNLPNDHVVALFKHRINRSNKEEYVLSYGSFTSYESANKALSQLSQSTRRYGAYARTFNSIHKEVKKLQTVTALAAPNDLIVNSGDNR